MKYGMHFVIEKANRVGNRFCNRVLSIFWKVAGFGRICGLVNL